MTSQSLSFPAETIPGKSHIKEMSDSAAKQGFTHLIVLGEKNKICNRYVKVSTVDTHTASSGSEFSCAFHDQTECLRISESILNDPHTYTYTQNTMPLYTAA